ncbi:PREDICTED: ABC transporter ATP-binding protein/permease wht-3-like isoform X2 [Vollenhovia emeryi]|uniref:ABC transporter ATP-binding protein/permease wht-3-like isoform X2 n=1 Tax=Vollenhovia emeryi TaxID=411798 RepID=UPI0005F4407E|nr:PREDICTED: ABC transporter ATP-binding protein/permease wht-3-like isoform X2 [Vollenhovia emeryi]
MISHVSELFWENLSVTVPARDDDCSTKLWCKFWRRKPVKVSNILKGVSGYAETGNMFAILGPNGAGKTTLLAALARRLELTSGAVKINGHDVSRETMTAISSYIPQFDVLPSALTPREHMSFMCALKIGSNCSVQQRKSLGEEFLRDLGLCECIDTAISELSGGERKRLSLAAELVTKPNICFLDEPTTGLDTSAALHVVQSLKLIASKGAMVFCTIHQPGMTIYNIFSHVILMAGGRSVYFGTLRNATEFFESDIFYAQPGLSVSRELRRVRVLRKRPVASSGLRSRAVPSVLTIAAIEGPRDRERPGFPRQPSKKIRMVRAVLLVALENIPAGQENGPRQLDRVVLLRAIYRLHIYLLRWHHVVDAGGDTERSGCVVLDHLRGDFHGRLLRRLRAARRACSVHARGYRVRAGALLSRHCSRLGSEGDVQGAPIHDRPVPGVAFRIFAARLLLLLSLHDGGGDLRCRVRHDDLQLDRRHRYRNRDNDTVRLVVSPDGGYVLQSADSAELPGVSQIFLRVLLRQ